MKVQVAYCLAAVGAGVDDGAVSVLQALVNRDSIDNSEQIAE